MGQVANIGTPQKVYEIPEPVSIPDTVPESVPLTTPVLPALPEPERVPV